MSNEVPLYGVKGGSEKIVIVEAPQNYLSFFDLQNVVGFISAKENQDKEELSRILWENGADISKPYTINYCCHRPRTSNIPYEGFRVEFTERTDKEWLLSGCASDDAKFHTLDISLKLELLRLDPRNSVHKKKPVDEDVECSVEVFDAGEDCI